MDTFVFSFDPIPFLNRIITSRPVWHPVFNTCDVSASMSVRTSIVPYPVPDKPPTSSLLTLFPV
jgi:hypothetical protein